MKRRILVTMTLLIISYQVAHPMTEAEREESRRIETSQVALWEENLAESRGKSGEERMSMLSLGLRNMRYRNSRPGHSSGVTSLFERLQNELLAIPGHAEYFAAPIWKAYREYRDRSLPKPGESSGDFEWEAKIGMETLQHLPSPETVRALGGMLWEDWQYEPGPNSTLQTVPSALAHQAVWTLLELPLRDKPTAFFDRNKAKENLPAWQAWYKRLESGEIPFSFKGQSVEYRFKPDGTWDTIPIANPPDDAPKAELPAPPENEQAKQPPTKTRAGNAKKPTMDWLLIGGLVALLSGVAALAMRIRRRT